MLEVAFAESRVRFWGASSLTEFACNSQHPLCVLQMLRESLFVDRFRDGLMRRDGFTKNFGVG